MSDDIISDEEKAALAVGPDDEDQSGEVNDQQQSDDQQAADEEQRARDEKGRFVAKEGEEEVQQEEKPKGDGKVPQGALHAERERRKAAEARAEDDIPLDEAQGMFPDVSSSALDATWAGRIDLKDGGEGNKPDYPEETRSALKDNKPPKSVRVVQIQWWDHDDVFMVAMPGEDQPREIPAEDWAQLQPEAEAQGITAQRVKKRRYYQAFLGKSSILDQAEKPCFSIQAQTGKLDRKRGYHYGWVRAMRDPQRLANKTLSNVNHIMTTNAKGGIMYEEGAFANPRDAEADWSNPSKSIKLKQGGIERIKDRTPPPMPPALVQLWDAAVSSFRDVTGINIEVMGLADREQPASLEYQRRQSAMTILAALFGSKRRYHKMHGETLLETLKLLPPGVLVRVLIDPKVAQAEYAQAMAQWQQAAAMAQQQGQQPPPQPEPPTAEFMKSTYRGEVFDPSAFGLDDDARFDVIVDETPFSPNQKEATWAALAPFMDRLPPAAVKTALKYSPLPETAAVEIGDAIEQGAGGGEIPPELQQAIEAGKEQISKLTEENQQLRQDQENKVAKLSIDKQDADTRRIKAEGDLSLETMQQRIDALHATVDRLLAAHQATKQDEGSADGY
jgi:hypothetical protein